MRAVRGCPEGVDGGDVTEPADTHGGSGAALAGVFDRAARRYDRTGVDFFGRIGSRLVAGAGLDAGARVLDVGCGSGACTVPAALAVGPSGSVCGIDTSAAMLDRARERAAELELTNVTLRQADAAGPPFSAGSFDAVLAGLVVFMLPDPLVAVRAYRELLRPDGVFAMSVFGADDPAFFQVTNAVLPYLDGGMPEVPGRGDSPLRTKAGIGELLRAASFTRRRILDEHLELEFEDPDQWWQWLWQTAGRVVLERIPAQRLPAARAAAQEQMDGVRADRGRYVVRWNVWFIYANRDSEDG